MNNKTLTQEDCFHLLKREETPEKVIRHCCKVSEVACLLGEALNQQEMNFDLDLIRVSGMLHDIARAKEEHWIVGADILSSMGYHREAHIIKHHMNHTPTTRLELLTELDLICLADRTVLENKFVGLDERMDYVLNKAKSHPDVIAIILAKKTITEDIIRKIEDKVQMTLEELVLKGDPMDLTQIMNNRHSTRKFKPIEVPDEDIERLVEAARIAPSGKNMQNWHFVAIKSQELKDKIRDEIQGKNESISGKVETIDPDKAMRFRKFCKNFTLFATEAPVLFVIFAKEYIPTGYVEYEMINAPKEILRDLIEHRNPGMQNIGAAVNSLSLKAVELGYGSCWITSANYAANEISELLKVQGVFHQEDYFMVAMLALGVPEEEGKSPGKKELNEILTLVK